MAVRFDEESSCGAAHCCDCCCKALLHQCGLWVFRSTACRSRFSSVRELDAFGIILFSDPREVATIAGALVLVGFVGWSEPVPVDNNLCAIIKKGSAEV